MLFSKSESVREATGELPLVANLNLARQCFEKREVAWRSGARNHAEIEGACAGHELIARV
jgi:hypothetical protein